MSTKPADYFVGLHDFFALLVPGAVLTFWASQRLRDETLGNFLPAKISSGPAAWIGFLLASFFVGQVLYSVAALLDGPGDRLSSRSVRKHETPYQEWLKNFPAGAKLRHVGMAWLRVNCPNAMPEVDRLVALSKFYRSLTAVFLILMFVGYPERLKSSGTGVPDEWKWKVSLLWVGLIAGLAAISFVAYVFYRMRHRKAVTLYLTIADARGSNEHGRTSNQRSGAGAAHA